jgi:hypothetical protein
VTVGRGLAFVLFILALRVAAFATDLPSPWRSWRYSRPIVGFPGSDRTPVTIRLPLDFFAHGDVHGSDLRIVDDRGQEDPYFLSVPQGESSAETRPSEILERSFVSGHFTQLVIRVTDKPLLEASHGATLEQLQPEPWFNTYRIATPESDFMFWVETSVSDDAHQWRIVDRRSPISRFRKHGLEGNQTVQFEGDSNQRFLRLRIFDPDRQFPVDAVEVLSRSSSEPPRTLIPAVFRAEQSADSTENRRCADLNSPNLPISEVDFSTDQPAFYRAVRISTSNDRKEWSFRAAGEVYRFHQAGKAKESLRITFPETFARFWCVDVVNGNDQHLANLGLELRGIERSVTFQLEPDRTYRLIYGNRRAFSPHYDFARIFDWKGIVPVASLGPEEVTANYADPRPYTERHPLFLWFVVGIAVVTLGYTALRALRAPKLSAE